MGSLRHRTICRPEVMNADLSRQGRVGVASRRFPFLPAVGAGQGRRSARSLCFRPLAGPQRRVCTRLRTEHGASHPKTRRPQMIFWGIVLALIALVLFLAWRKDRKHQVTINRRNPAAENDI